MIIICLRDPDSSNEFLTFTKGSHEPRIIDVDFGRADLRDPEEFAEWKASLLDEAEFLARQSTLNAQDAAKELFGIIDQAVEDFGHDS